MCIVGSVAVDFLDAEFKFVWFLEYSIAVVPKLWCA